MEVAILYCGFLLMAYALAVVLFVFVESPSAQLIKILIK